MAELAQAARAEVSPDAPVVATKRGTGPRAYRGTSELWDHKDRFIAWMKATGYSKCTFKAAHADMSWLLRWLEARDMDRLADITPDVLEQYSVSLMQLRNGLPPSISHIARRLYSLKMFFQWLAREAVILHDPAEDLELPKQQHDLPHVILTQQEARRLLDAPELRSPVGYRDKALLELLYASGVRTAELIALKVSDIDTKSNIVHVRQGKGRKDRDVPIPPLAMRWVKEYIEKVRPNFAKRRRVDDGTLWLNYTGGLLDKNRLVEVFKRNRKLAALDKHVTAITLRHSLASHLIENGMAIRYVMEILGHDRLSTTQVYCKVTLSGLRRHWAAAHPRERAWAKAKSNGPQTGQ